MLHLLVVNLPTLQFNVHANYLVK